MSGSDESDDVDVGLLIDELEYSTALSNLDSAGIGVFRNSKADCGEPWSATVVRCADPSTGNVQRTPIKSKEQRKRKEETKKPTLTPNK